MTKKDLGLLAALWAFLRGTTFGERLAQMLIDDLGLAVAEAERIALWVRNRSWYLLIVEMVLFMALLVFWAISAGCKALDWTAASNIFYFFVAIMLMFMGLIVVLLYAFVPVEHDFSGRRARDILRIVRTVLRPLSILAFLVLFVAFCMVALPFDLPFSFKLVTFGFFLVCFAWANITGSRSNFPYTFLTLLSGGIFLLVTFFLYLDTFGNEGVVKSWVESKKERTNKLLTEDKAKDLTEEITLKASDLYACGRSDCAKIAGQTIHAGYKLWVNRSLTRLLYGDLQVVFVRDPEKHTRVGYVLAMNLSGPQSKAETGGEIPLIELSVGESKWVKIDQSERFIHTLIAMQPRNGLGRAKHEFEVYESDKKTHPTTKNAMNGWYINGTQDVPHFPVSNPDEDMWTGDWFKLKGVQSYVSPTRPLWVKITRTR